MSAEPSMMGAAVPTRSRIRWAIVVGLFLVLLGVIGGLLRYKLDPVRLRAAIESRLAAGIGGTAALQSAAYSWTEGIRLKGLTLTGTSESGRLETASGQWVAGMVVVHFPELLLQCQPLGMLMGNPRIDTVVLTEPTLTIHVPGGAGEDFEWMDSFRSLLPRSGGRTAALPSIDVRNARLRVLQGDAKSARVLDDIRLTLRGAPSRSQPRLYEISWESTTPSSDVGRVAVDLERPGLAVVQGGSPWVTLESGAVLLGAAGPPLRAWADDARLRGRIRMRQWNPPNPSIGADGSASFELEGIEGSIPVQDSERESAAEPRFLAFYELAGQGQWDGSGLSLQLQGQLRGATVHLSAQASAPFHDVGAFREASAELSLSVQGLVLPQTGPSAPPEQARIVGQWRPLRIMYQDYDPHGPIDLSVQLRRAAGRDQPVTLSRFELTARGGDASCRFFPYRLTDLAGTATLDENGLTIRELCGVHDQAKVCVEGSAAALNRCAALDINVRGREVLIDDDLRRSLPAAQQELVRRFDPQGRIDVAVSIIREACQDGVPARPQVSYEVDLRSVEALYDQLPIPVNRITGAIAWAPDGELSVDVSGAARGATVRVDGHAFLPVIGSSVQETEKQHLDMTVRVSEGDYDERWEAALPPSIQSFLSRFRIRGPFDLISRLRMDQPVQCIRHDTRVTLRGMSANVGAAEVALTELSGPIRLDSDHVHLEGVRGRWGGSGLMVTGAAALRGGGLELDFRCDPFILDDAFRAALPPELQRGLKPWTITGNLSMDTRYCRGEGTSGEGELTTTVQVKGASVRHAGFPQPLENVQGELRVQDSRITIDPLRAVLGGGTVSVGGEVLYAGDVKTTNLRIDAQGLMLTRLMRDVLPQQVLASWDRLQLTGQGDLQVQELVIRQESTGAELQASGQAAILSLLWSGKYPGRAGNLMVDGVGRWRRGEGLCFQGSVTSAQTQVLDRSFTEVGGRWSWTSRAGSNAEFSLQNLSGSIGGGLVTCDLQWQPTSDRREYSLSATLHQARLESLIVKSGSTALPNELPPEVSGLVDARLKLSGSSQGSAAAQTGMGRFRITDARIFRTPLILAILNVLNLSLPDEDAFDEVQAEFFVEGNRVEFTDLQLHSKGLILLGTGTLSVPDWTVDLRLVHVNSRWWLQVPVVTNLLENAARELVQLHVTGPLNRPVVRAVPLRALTDEFKSLLQKRKPKPIQPIDP